MGIDLNYDSDLEGDSDELVASFGFTVRSTATCVLVSILERTHTKPEVKRSAVNRAERVRCEEELTSFLETMPNFHASFFDIEAAGLVDALLGYTDMGADDAFAYVERMEAKYVQMDRMSILDDLYDL